MSDGPSIVPPGARALSDDERVELLEEMEAIIGRSHLFKSLDEAGRARVLASGYVCSFEAGEKLVSEGETGDTMYLILNGSVKVQAKKSGGVVDLATLGRDACVGEVSLLTGRERTATVTAETDVDAVAFAKHRIERVLADYPKVRALLEALVEGRARDTIEKIVKS